MTVKLPAGSRVEAKAASAELRTVGRLGDVAFEGAYRQIKLDEAASIHLTAVAGDIEVGRLGGAAEISTAQGDITIAEAMGGTVVLSTQSGDITVGAAPGQGPGQTVVVEQNRLDTEDLLNRPGTGPVTNPHQRRGRGQPIGHQRLNHLPVRQVSARTAQAQPVDDPRHIQPAQKLGSDRQSAQTLLHHGCHHHIKALTLRPWPRGPGSHRHTPPNATPPAGDTPTPVTPYESTTREVRD